MRIACARTWATEAAGGSMPTLAAPRRMVNLADVPVCDQHSPKGKFRLKRQHVSLLLGGRKDTGPWGGGHPFDVERVTVPPGAANWPFHWHTAQWEFYWVMSGEGRVRTEGGTLRIAVGDCIVFAPHEGHQITNTGEADLVYLVIADNPPGDQGFLPESRKWHDRHTRTSYRMAETGFFAEEE